jgi:hypothetical protein
LILHGENSTVKTGKFKDRLSSTSKIDKLTLGRQECKTAAGRQSSKRRLQPEQLRLDWLHCGENF